METKELAIAYINDVKGQKKIEDLYRYTTKDTIFFSIDEKKNVTMEEWMKQMMPFILKEEPTIFVSPVCVKFVYRVNQQELHLYFEAKRNRLLRIEYAITK